MNPNARSFAFNPNAQGFVPPGQGQQQQQQQQQQQPGGNPYAQQGYYQQGFNQQSYAAGFPGQPYQQYAQGGYQAYTQQGFTNQQYAQQGFNQPPRPSQAHHDIPSKPVATPSLPPNPAVAAAATAAKDQAPRKPVSISIGGGPKPADKKPVSISIGGASKKDEATKAENNSAPTESAPVMPAAGVTAVKAAAAAADDSPATSSPSGTLSRAESPAPVATATKKPAAAKPVVPTEKSVTTADEVLAEVKKATDEETMRDLFGDKVDSLKSHLNIVFIGHVDAGKSTMGGNLLYLTGMVDKRTLEKYEREAKEAGRESWYLSWALDSTAQEREKGKTVEVGRAYFETGKRRYTILDAPGHKSFVPHMISGAAQADVAVLVISARKGEFETGFERGGQTREHAVLVKTAGVQKLIVVINKMDEPTVQWKKERYDEIVTKLTPFLRGTGFNPKTDVTFIPVSAFSGQNLKDPVPKDVCSWWSGPSLLEHLDNVALSDRKVASPLKMPISEKYNDMGTVLVGKLEAGKIQKGDNLCIMPNKTTVEVVAIFNEQEEEIPVAISGDNVRVKVKGVDHDEVSVGFVLSDLKEPVHVTTRFEAQLAILEHRNIICAGYNAVMHCHTASEEVSLSALLHYYDKKTGKKSKRGPQFAKKGMKIIALIEAVAPVCIERFKDYPQLGRFTLRDEGRTIAIGKVTKLITSEEELPDVAKLSVTDSAAGAA